MLGQVKTHLSYDSVYNRLGYPAKRNILAIDYLLNKHPNREAIFGANSDWTFDIEDNMRSKIAVDNEN